MSRPGWLRRHRRLLLWLGGLVFLGGLVTAVVLLDLPDRLRTTPVGHAGRELLQRLRERPDRLVAPGPLAPLHRDQPELTDCFRCHGLLETVTDAKCLACHEEIGQRLADGAGYHGRDLVGRCAGCHADHRQALIQLERSTFDHARAIYPLRGRHAGVACEACHEVERAPPGSGTRLDWIGLPCGACRDCHPGPHGDQFGTTSCEVCHTERGWIGPELTFRHETYDRYPLLGKHQQVACTACHRPENVAEDGPAGTVYRGLEHRCAACHEDPHGGQFEGTACEACHTERGWTGSELTFRHETYERYLLVGKHRQVTCAACHPAAEETTTPTAATYRGLEHRCAACHQDPHGGQFGATTCETCHTERGWTGSELTFRHETYERYPLVGKHRQVTCAACHPAAEETTGPTAATYRGLEHRCAACHQDPHGGQFGATTCQSCHTERGWTGPELTFSHEEFAPYPLTGAHARVPCARCHPLPEAGAPFATARFRGVGHGCTECHEDPHQQSLAHRACTACHVTEAWRGPAVTFDHQRDARFTLDATHRGLGCTDCHATQVYRPVTMECAGCHPTAAADVAGRVQVGERIEDWRPGPHAGRVSCQQCHRATMTSQDPEAHAAICASCHTAHYAGLHLGRRAHLDTLIREARALEAQLAATGPLREELEACERVGSHNHVAAEKRLEGLVERLRRMARHPPR